MDRIIFRKGLDAQLPNIVPDVGNPGWITDKRILYVGDGSSTPPRIATNKSLGDYSYATLDSLTLPGGLVFRNSRPGAIGPITPSRMVSTRGILAYTGLDTNGQDTWSNSTVTSQNSTLVISNGDGSRPTINIAINPDSEILKTIIKNNANVQAGNIEGINTLINNLINAAISTNDTVHYGIDSSNSPNTILVSSFDNPMTSLPPGTTIAINVANSNTGVTTANFGSTLGQNIPVVRMDGSPLKQNDLIRGLIYFGMRDDGKLAVLNYNPTSVPLRNSLAFRDTTTWTVPDGCYFIFARVWGAGGGGGGSFGTPSAGSAGAGGGYAEGFYFVMPGDVLSVNIGAGGIEGTNGGISFLGSKLFATGGTSGAGGNGIIQTGGNGFYGSGGGGQLNLNGASGGLGFQIGNSGVVGIGGWAPFSSGVPALNIGDSNNPAPAAAGVFPAGGGNGGSQGSPGGPGAKGLILVSF